MRLVVGLGNPGREHERSRHNVGFRVLDRVAERRNVRRWRKGYRGLLAEGSFGGEKVLLLKPQTYMNASGLSARAALDRHGLALEEVLVVADDVNLPLGRLRFRRSGSGGGHNGLASVIEEVGSEEIPRLRIGVARRPEADLVEYVLSEFDAEELPVIGPAESLAAEAVRDWVRFGIVPCMNKYNSGEVKP